MWPDADNFAKRKPQSLGGTPANKFSAILCLSTVVSFAVLLNVLSYTPYVKRKIANVEKGVIQTEKNREVKAFLTDPLVQGAIQRKKKEYEEEPHIFGWF